MEADPSLSAVRGLLPVVQTPFLADESIDYDTYRRELDWVFTHQVDGVVVAMVSEVLRLSSVERDELIAVTAEVCGQRGLVSVGSVGAESTRVAVGHARTAQSNGASAVMITPPMLTGHSETSLRRYFGAVIEAIDLPVIIQDASGYVGKAMSAGFQASLWREHGPRVLFKPEAHPIGPQLTELLDATDGRAGIFDGTGGIFLVEAHRRGVIGTMPAADLIWAVAALWRALEDGDVDRADGIADPLSRIVSMQTSLDSFVAIEKHLLVAQAVFESARLRAPDSSGLDAVTLAEVDRLVEQLRAAVDARP